MSAARGRATAPARVVGYVGDRKLRGELEAAGNDGEKGRYNDTVVYGVPDGSTPNAVQSYINAGKTLYSLLGTEEDVEECFDRVIVARQKVYRGTVAPRQASRLARLALLKEYGGSHERDAYSEFINGIKKDECKYGQNIVAAFRVKLISESLPDSDDSDAELSGSDDSDDSDEEAAFSSQSHLIEDDMGRLQEFRTPGKGDRAKLNQSLSDMRVVVSKIETTAAQLQLVASDASSLESPSLADLFGEMSASVKKCLEDTELADSNLDDQEFENPHQKDVYDLAEKLEELLNLGAGAVRSMGDLASGAFTFGDALPVDRAKVLWWELVRHRDQLEQNNARLAESLGDDPAPAAMMADALRVEGINATIEALNGMIDTALQMEEQEAADAAAGGGDRDETAQRHAKAREVIIEGLTPDLVKRDYEGMLRRAAFADTIKRSGRIRKRLAFIEDKSPSAVYDTRLDEFGACVDEFAVQKDGLAATFAGSSPGMGDGTPLLDAATSAFNDEAQNLRSVRTLFPESPESGADFAAAFPQSEDPDSE